MSGLQQRTCSYAEAVVHPDANDVGALHFMASFVEMEQHSGLTADDSDSGNMSPPSTSAYASMSTANPSTIGMFATPLLFSLQTMPLNSAPEEMSPANAAVKPTTSGAYAVLSTACPSTVSMFASAFAPTVAMVAANMIAADISTPSSPTPTEIDSDDDEPPSPDLYASRAALIPMDSDQEPGAYAALSKAHPSTISMFASPILSAVVTHMVVMDSPLPPALETADHSIEAVGAIAVEEEDAGADEDGETGVPEAAGVLTPQRMNARAGVLVPPPGSVSARKSKFEDPASFEAKEQGSTNTAITVTPGTAKSRAAFFEQGSQA